MRSNLKQFTTGDSRTLAWWRFVGRGLLGCLIGGSSMIGCSAKRAGEADWAKGDVPARFSTPESAVSALVDAARVVDKQKLERLFGPENDEIYSSGDAVADRNILKKLAELYDERHFLETNKDGSKTLFIGNIEWPFAVPLVKNAEDKWIFDGVAGVAEVVNRRIGRNELMAIQTCQELIEAQLDYYDIDPDGDGKKQFATRILSSPGTKDGLFWPRQPKSPPSPLGPLLVTAEMGGYHFAGASGSPRPYNGYYFRILPQKKVGGAKGKAKFTILAYPAEYGVSGVMTFLANEKGEILEKNLGDDTEQIASSVDSVQPSDGWAIAEAEEKDSEEVGNKQVPQNVAAGATLSSTKATGAEKAIDAN